MLVFLMCMTGFAGFVDSAAGGGGLISLPAYLFAGLPPHYTYGTNKFSAACGTTFATVNFFRSGAMNIKVGLLAAVGSFAGSALGSHVVLLLSDEALQAIAFAQKADEGSSVYFTAVELPQHTVGRQQVQRQGCHMLEATGRLVPQLGVMALQHELAAHLLQKLGDEAHLVGEGSVQ